MRLWHYELIPVLPRSQLISQLRECVAIAKALYEKGTPNHILVNKVINYSYDEFYSYCWLVLDELKKRGYKYRQQTVDKIELYLNGVGNPINRIRLPKETKLFKGWHNQSYLTQCYFNLQEKRDCGGITEDEWKLINDYFIGTINKYCVGFSSSKV